MLDLIAAFGPLMGIIGLFLTGALVPNYAEAIKQQEKERDEVIKRLQAAQIALQSNWLDIPLPIRPRPKPDPYVPFDPDLAEIEAIVPEFIEDQLKWKKTL